MFTGCSDVLCSQKISKKKIIFCLKSYFRQLHSSIRSNTFLTACWLSIFMLSEPSRMVLWISRSGPRFQSRAGGLKRKLTKAM